MSRSALLLAAGLVLAAALAAWLLSRGGDGERPADGPGLRPGAVPEAPPPEPPRAPDAEPPAPVPAPAAPPATGGVDVGAAPAPPPPPAALWEDRVVWHEGDREHRIHASRRLVAEIRRPGGGAGWGEPLLEGARLVRDAPAVRIWELPEGLEARDALTALRASPAPRDLSPVFQPEAGEGPVQALPGGVVLQLDPTWDAERVRAFAEAEDLPPPSAMTVGPGWFRVATATGEAALLLAERLHGRPGVLLAAPDWWRDYALR